MGCDSCRRLEEDPDDPITPKCERTPPERCALDEWQKKLSTAALAAYALTARARAAERLGIEPPAERRLLLSASTAGRVWDLLEVIDAEMARQERREEERRERRWRAKIRG